MLESLKQNPALLNMRKQYEMLPSRDRAALKLLTIAISIVILIFGILQPAYEYKKNSELKLEESQKLLALVNDNRLLLSSSARSSGNSSSKKVLNSQQLVSSVTSMAKKQQVALKRFEPSGERKLKVWVDDESFDKVISWLGRLKSSLGVKVEQISIDKDDDPGKISARMTLSS
jgi:general secretion pathway protein M